MSCPCQRHARVASHPFLPRAQASEVLHRSRHLSSEQLKLQSPLEPPVHLHVHVTVGVALHQGSRRLCVPFFVRTFSREVFSTREMFLTRVRCTGGFWILHACNGTRAAWGTARQWVALALVVVVVALVVVVVVMVVVVVRETRGANGR